MDQRTRRRLPPSIAAAMDELKAALSNLCAPDVFFAQARHEAVAV